MPYELRLGRLKLLADDAPPGVATPPDIVPDDLVAEQSGPSGPGRLPVSPLDVLTGVVDPEDIDDPVAGVRADDPSGEGFAEIRRQEPAVDIRHFDPVLVLDLREQPIAGRGYREVLGG